MSRAIEVYEDDFEHPPQSWREPAKAHWLDLPEVVQEEIIRTERRIEAALERAAQATKRANTAGRLLSEAMDIQP